MEVNAHYNLTLSDDGLLEKSETIFKSLGFELESYLHFCFKIFKIANWRISPISYTAWKLICCSKYFKAFCGLLLFNKRKAFLLVDRSVYFWSSSSISSSMSPIISEPNVMNTL